MATEQLSAAERERSKGGSMTSRLARSAAVIRGVGGVAVATDSAAGRPASPPW
jgi:hypothetical protein